MGKPEIILKTPQEIELMREAGKAHAKVTAEIKSFVRAGISTYDIEQFVRETCKKLNVIPAQIGYFDYPCAICASVNDDAVHTIPSTDKILRDGDILAVDTVIKKDGWLADSGFTLPIGKVDAPGLLLIETAEKALAAGIAATTVGNTVNKISAAIYGVARSVGLDVLQEFSGHGVGQDMHEGPNISNVPNIGAPDEVVVLKEGMTLALDTMLVERKGEIVVMSDGWSTKTCDGSRFAFFEHTVAVTEDGPEILTSG